MSTSDFIVDVDGANGEEYLKMHGYWVYPRASQECTAYTDRSSSCGSEFTGSGAAGGTETAADGGALPRSGPCGLNTPRPPYQKPHVEDDVDDDDEDGGDVVARAALEHFLKGSASGHICLSPIDMSPTTYDGGDGNDSFPPSMSSTTDAVDGGFPHLEEEVLGDLGDIIGYGGDHGSFVCRVPPPPQLLRMGRAQAKEPWSPAVLACARRQEVAARAYKKYPTRVSAEELSFVATAYRCARNSEQCQSSVSSPFLSSDEARYAALHLVLPEAVVSANGANVGLLMPLYNCSLKEHLQSLTRSSSSARGSPSRPLSLTMSRTSSLQPDEYGVLCGGGGPPWGSFRCSMAFRPVDSIAVVSAIAFQMLEAVAFLNHRLPHGDRSTGYTHNDLHLDNMLLSYAGDVALCDFELVASSPTPSHTIDIRRLPPSSRQSPHGLFNETADTWAFGLMLVSLLTGVDPLFTSDIVNDFSDGPLLCRWDRSARVLDWEANIGAHVRVLLRSQDPSGKRLEDAQSLLQLCAKCLVNRCGAVPLRAVDLLEEEIFRPFRRDFDLATRTVRDWIQGARHP